MKSPQDKLPDGRRSRQVEKDMFLKVDPHPFTEATALWGMMTVSPSQEIKECWGRG